MDLCVQHWLKFQYGTNTHTNTYKDWFTGVYINQIVLVFKLKIK